MTAMELVLIFAGLAALVLAAVLAWFYFRREALRRKFGPEYDRLASEMDTIGAAEHELRDRAQRHAQLQLKELTPEARNGYAQQWQQLQSKFIDSPQDAVGEADQLVTRLITDLGYPTSGFDEQAALLSVEHARTLGDYRTAHDIALRHERGQADTEELRQAIVHYRTIVADLLGGDPVEMHDATPSPRRRTPHAA
jgi:hypothetical protein